jgi:ribosomal protein S21
LEEERRGRPVEERGRDFEGMVKRWKRNSQTVVAEFKRRRYYQPPSEQRRLAKAKAEKRARRAQIKRERAERRNG